MKTILTLFTAFLLVFPFVANAHGDEQKCECHHECAFLGINSNTVSKKKAEKLGFDYPNGSYVASVIKNTAADRAGLQYFDYVFGIDEYRTGENQSLSRILQKFKEGQDGTVHYVRKGQKKQVKVTFTSKDEAKRSSRNKCDEPFFGIRHYSNNSDMDGVGISVVANSTAKEMGLEKGDVITNINDYPIYDWDDISTAINNMTAGENIKVAYVRNGQASTKNMNIKSYCETKPEEKKYSYNNDHDDDYDYDDDSYGNRRDFNLNLNFDFDELEDDVEEVIEEMEETIREAGEKLRARFGNDTNLRIVEDEVPVDDLSVDWEEVNNNDANRMRTDFGVDMPLTNNLQVNELKLSPNPNRGMFVLNFNLSSRGDTRVQIFNAAGRQIYDYELSNFSGNFNDDIDISQNGSGAYFLQITQGSQSLVKKIILNKI